MRGVKRIATREQVEKNRITQCAKEPLTPIEIEFTSLQDNICSLEEHIQKLSDRLEPVLNTADVCPAASMISPDEDGSRSPLGRRIMASRDRVYSMINCVCSLTDRLEI